MIEFIFGFGLGLAVMILISIYKQVLTGWFGLMDQNLYEYELRRNGW